MQRLKLRMNSTADGCAIRLTQDGPYGKAGQLVTLSPSRARQMVADGIAEDPNARAVKPVPPAPASTAPVNAHPGRFSARLFKIREAEAAVKAAEAALAAAEAE